ncbi:MAG: 16S rRNA (cytosine(967)-C(5))-methyltransferase RsmB [Acidimicrobiia bacterium]|nr:16S rRNA (cytosine(967)-C(5))-methyltransferase RsmB [Acidimicrobiia bacterium]
MALEALVRVEQGAFANLLLPELLRRSALSRRDRAFATELVYGTLRRQRALDFLLAGCLDRRLGALDAEVRAGLRLGAHQLVAGVPAHAAVGETVTAVARRRPRSRPLVNAVLRATARLGPPWPWPEGDDVASVAIRTSHPDWMVERLVAAVGLDAATATLEADNASAAVTLRPHRGRSTPEALAAELVASGATVEPGRLVPGALVVRGTGDPARLPAVAEGRATPQDEGSQAVVEVLDPRPGERVLEVAAAPGGKATAIGERVGPGGLVVAVDVHPGRTRLVGAAATRLGLPAVVPVVADGRALPLAGWFDRVLLDAPCTGLGVLRRRPEARWRVGPEDPARLAALQQALVAEAAGALSAGGTLVYSVCTWTDEETRGVDRWAAEALPYLVPADPPGPPWRPWGRGALLLPGDTGTDGMFVLALRRPPAAGDGRGTG